MIDRLREILYSQRTLLIVDDAWTAGQAAPFKQIAGPQCGLLITTRFADVARELANSPEADVYRVGILTTESALELLRRVAPSVVHRYPDHSRALVQDLEALPLALRVAGRMLAAQAELGVELEPHFVELRESHAILNEVAPDDRFDPHAGVTPTVKLLLQKSTDLLDEPVRSRFAMLGAFAPKPATFDLEAIRFVWQTDDVFQSIRTLVDRGLQRVGFGCTPF